MDKFDWKYIGLLIFLIVLAFSSFYLKDDIYKYISLLLNHKNLILCVAIISAMIDVTHTIKYKNFNFSHTMSFSHFKKSFDFFLSFVGNPITIVSAVALVKGLFLHWTDQDIYFPAFENLELIFIATVTLYLLIVSILELKTHLFEIIKTPLSGEEAIPVDDPSS